MPLKTHDSFTGVVQATNRPMLALLRHLNARTVAREGGTARLVADLPRSFRAATRLPRRPLLEAPDGTLARGSPGSQRRDHLY